MSESSSSSSSTIYRGLINSTSDQVVESIDGFLLAHPHCRKLDGGRDIKVVVRSDWDRSSTADVALLSGGGDGHAPSHSGFVGSAMLTCAVSGEVFASPSVKAVLAGIRAIGRAATKDEPNVPGVLLIVKSYTGDRLNFGIALSQAQVEGIPVEMVIVGDDVALPRSKGVTGRRGLAGTVLVHKIAGYAASQHMSLHEVAAKAEQVARNIVTLGVATAACNVPGANVYEARLPLGKMEIGMGIHNEAGASQLPLESSTRVVTRLIDQLLSTAPESDYFYRWSVEEMPRSTKLDGTEIVLLVNNLGASTATEVNLFVSEAIRQLTERGLIVRRLLVGTFMTALDMKGISLTLWRLDSDPSTRDWQLAGLDSAVGATGWPSSAAIVKDPRVSQPLPVPTAPNVTTAESTSTVGTAAVDPSTASLFQMLADAILNNTSRLNELDALSGDGDCGTTLAIGANALKEIRLPTDATLSITLSTIGTLIGEKMGGTSGAIIQILLTSAAANAATASSASFSSSSTSTASVFVDSLLAGCNAVTKFGGARVGYRTMLDALLPSVEAMQQALKKAPSNDSIAAITSAAEAARRGADSTKGMEARAGRANYVSGAALSENDPGAEAVALLWAAALEWAKSQKQ